MTDAARVAGAPISWGVCEVPGWGHQMTAARVFDEVRAVGLRAAEAGPEGFLSSDPGTARAFLGGRGLHLVGGFVPAVLHAPRATALAPVERQVRWLAAAGADVVVLAADGGGDGYDADVALDDAAWRRLLANLDAAAELAAEHGLLAALHPHVGTVVERQSEVDRVLEGSAIALCLDTGHQLIGGIDPVALTKAARDRIRHVQLKDVNADLAAQVAAGAQTYTEAVRRGMYVPLGTGDVDVAAITGLLHDYDGWFVLEQDVVLDAEPPVDEGPMTDVARSLDYLRSFDLTVRRRKEPRCT